MFGRWLRIEFDLEHDTFKVAYLGGRVPDDVMARDEFVEFLRALADELDVEE